MCLIDDVEYEIGSYPLISESMSSANRRDQLEAVLQGGTGLKASVLEAGFADTSLPRQSQVKTNWYVITGAPCSGKTTILDRLANLGFDTSPEIGRQVIERALSAGYSTEEIFSDQQLLQTIILKEKIETHSALDPTNLIVLEDGLPESLAYHRYSGLETPGLRQVVDRYLYKKVLFFDRLPLVNDSARPQNEEEIRKLQRAKEQAYLDLGYELVRIPVLPVEERVAFVINLIE